MGEGWWDMKITPAPRKCSAEQKEEGAKLTSQHLFLSMLPLPYWEEQIGGIKQS